VEDLSARINFTDKIPVGAAAHSEVHAVTFASNRSEKDILHGEKGRLCLKVLKTPFNDHGEVDYAIHEIRFRKDVAAWTSFIHPNINRFYGLASDPSPFRPYLCLISHFCPNYNVTRYLRARPDADKKRIISDAARGLLYLHDREVVHGDVKPNNVLIDEDGRAVLCDFGLSVIFEDPTINPQADSQIPTQEYSAPELFGSSANGFTSGPRTKPTDVWAFGCTAMQILSGIPPYEGVHRFRLVLEITNGTPPFKNIDDDSPLGRVITDCLAFQSRMRIQMKDVVARLDGPDLGETSDTYSPGVQGASILLWLPNAAMDIISRFMFYWSSDSK